MIDTKFKKGMIPWNKKEDSIVEGKCLFCDTVFTFNQYRVKKGRKKFCSASCRSKHSSKQPSAEIRFWGSVEKTDTCWIWMASKANFGYGTFSVNGKLVRTHRYSYELHNGEIPHGLNVLHKCDNPSCVNPDHLFLGTQKDNAQDMLSKGRDSSGEKHSKILRAVSLNGENHPHVRFTDNDVIEMRRLCNEENIARKDVAKRFRTIASVVGNIVTYRERKYVS